MALARKIHNACRCLYWAVLFALFFSAPTKACTVCIGYPQKTAVDFLLESSCVVLAREDSGQPFSYAPVEILKGELKGEKIDLFLNSLTRRILAADGNRRAILVQDADGHSWRSLGVASAEYEAMVRRIVAFTPQWQHANGSPKRTEFFLQLFGHKNARIHELAYLEMGRAPYHAIKQLSRVVRPEQFEPILHSRQHIEWRSLAILILANRGEAKDRQYVAESFRTVRRFGLTTNLAAWAAASIEIEGAEAVSVIEDQYFRDADRKQQELVEVIKAVSMHGTEGRTGLRDQIVESYGVLLDVHSDMAPYVAIDLLAWKRSELRQELSNIEATHTSLDDAGRKAIREYLKSTTDAESVRDSD